MAGKYQGVQARVKELNLYAEYVPCFGHLLNLILNDATFLTSCRICKHSSVFPLIIGQFWLYTVVGKKQDIT